MTDFLARLGGLTAKDSALVEQMAEEFCETEASEAAACG